MFLFFSTVRHSTSFVLCTYFYFHQFYFLRINLVLFIISFEIVLFINGKWLSCVHFRFQGAFYSNVSTQILKNSFNLMLLFSETVLDNLGLIRPYTDRLEILIVVVVGVLSILGWNFLMIVFMTVSVILENLTDLSQLLISFGNI